jgi:hypothetical protein
VNAVQSDRLRIKLLEYHQRQNASHLWERLNQALGDAASSAKLVISPREQAPVGNATKPALTVYPETYLQMRELTQSVLDAIAADKWRITIVPEYPEIVLPAAILVEYLDNLLEEFEWFSIRPKRARTLSLYLDKDTDRQEYCLTVMGRTLTQCLYDHHGRIVFRDYGWNIPAGESPCGKQHSITMRLRRGQATTMACLLALENTGLVADCLARVKTRLGYLLRREMVWDYNTILDKSTQQWLRLSLHRPLTPSGALWRVELVGHDFLRAFREVLCEVSRQVRIVTEIVA